MFNRTVAAIAALVSVSAAVAATVSIIPATNLPSDAPKVTFDNLPTSSYIPAAGQPRLTSYTERALTLHYDGIVGWTNSNGAWSGNAAILGIYTYTTADQIALFSFSEPVSQIAFSEYVYPVNAITLFADSAGTEVIGQFNTTHAMPPSGGSTFAFQSDTPFRSFSVVTQPTRSFYIDDLRYANAIPEPSALFACVGSIGAMIGLQRRRRA